MKQYAGFDQYAVLNGKLLKAGDRRFIRQNGEDRVKCIFNTFYKNL